MELIDQAQEKLKQYFGHDKFRPGQREILTKVFAGEDVLGIMPTGSGKSLSSEVRVSSEDTDLLTRFKELRQVLAAEEKEYNIRLCQTILAELGVE
ncbi:hypothetical protein [Halanaerobaculum tunisiense]